MNLFRRMQLVDLSVSRVVEVKLDIYVANFKCKLKLTCNEGIVTKAKIVYYYGRNLVLITPVVECAMFQVSKEQKCYI